MKCNKKTCSSDILEFPTQYRKQMNMSTNHSTKKSLYSHLSASERGEISAYLKMGKTPLRLLVCLGIIAQPSVVKSNEEVFLRFKTRTGNESTQRFTFQIVVNVFMKPIVKKVPIINYRTAPGPSSRNLRKS